MFNMAIQEADIRKQIPSCATLAISLLAPLTEFETPDKLPWKTFSVVDALKQKVIVPNQTFVQYHKKISIAQEVLERYFITYDGHFFDDTLRMDPIQIFTPPESPQ